MTGTEAAERAKQELSKLTGLRADTVCALSHEEDGWHVTVDLIELKRIPESTDVLDSYETLLDDNGNLLTYKRTQRTSRAGDLMKAA